MNYHSFLAATQLNQPILKQIAMQQTTPVPQPIPDFKPVPTDINLYPYCFDGNQFGDNRDCAIARAVKEQFNTNDVRVSYSYTVVNRRFVYEHQLYDSKHFNSDRLRSKFNKLFGIKKPIRTVHLTPLKSGTVNGVAPIVDGVIQGPYDYEQLTTALTRFITRAEQQ